VRRRKRADPIIEALRRTAEGLGNTLAVTRSSYVHPGVIEAFDGEAAANGAARRSRDLDGPADRRTELEVLALLRRAGPSARASRPVKQPAARRAARRSQVGGGVVAGRSRRPRA
jgi:DNA topoisomerase IB